MTDGQSMASDLAEQISEQAHSAGIPLSDEQARLCRIHLELTFEWNRRFNLTRITDPREAIIKHLLDSLLPASTLPRSGPALDVGTGAGFPGIPIKIFSPDLEMTLLDSSQKKVSFLAAAAEKLGTGGFRPLHGRWEDLAKDPKNKNSFQLITMRAVRLEKRHLSILAAATLRSGGIFAWWAGPESEERARKELSEAEIPGIAPRERFSYTLPDISRPRSILSWEKL